MGRGGRGHSTLPLVNLVGALREVKPTHDWWSHTDRSAPRVTVTPPRTDAFFTISYLLPPCETVPITVKLVHVERDADTLYIYLNIATGGIKPLPGRESNVPWGSLQFSPEDVSDLKQVRIQTETSQLVAPWPVDDIPTSS